MPHNSHRTANGPTSLISPRVPAVEQALRSPDARPSQAPPAVATTVPGPSPAPASPCLADSLLNVANLHYANGDLQACADALRSALTTAPRQVQIRVALGTVCFQTGNFTEARAQFEQALQLDPQNVILHVQVATACHRLEDAPGLTKALQQALAIDPENKEALTLLGSVYFQGRRFGEAANLYEQLLARHAENVEWLLLLAKCRFHLGDVSAARELYERVRQIEPGNPITIEALTLLEKGAHGTHPLSVLDILRENPVLHHDQNGKPVYMSISGAVANFIHQRIQEGTRTIETGAGLSTLCFMAKGTHHTAIAPDPGLEPRLREYGRMRGLREDRLTYMPKTSQDVVWSLDGEYDCALIDGGHGFPIPFIDFFYLNRVLKKGGFLIIDDLEIWTGETLAKFLSCERSWKVVLQDGNRAIVFQKVGDAKATEWTAQEFVVKSSLHPHYLETIIKRDTLPDATAA